MFSFTADSIALTHKPKQLTLTVVGFVFSTPFTATTVCQLTPVSVFRCLLPQIADYCYRCRSLSTSVEFMSHPLSSLSVEVLGPILFIMYTADLIALVEPHDLCPQLYADDMQIYGSCYQQLYMISNNVCLRAWMMGGVES